MARSRRDDLEICMEILEFIVTNIDLSITDIAQYVRVKHAKAKQLLESMERSNWIRGIMSTSSDLRYKAFYEILPEGIDVLKLYEEQLKKLFYFLGNPEKA